MPNNYSHHSNAVFLECDNLTHAWEKINEYLLNNEKNIFERGGGVYGSSLISYDNIIRISKAEVDPEFDFGKILGYTKIKWSSLINNYLDKNYVELIRNELHYRHGRKAKSYNYSYHFANFAGNGKDCLISLVFHKRLTNQKPIVYFHLRTSEVTKRLLFDFLLVQRIIEHVFGHNEVEVHCFFPSMYITAESILLYHIHKDITEGIKDKFKESKYLTRVVRQLRYLTDTPLKNIKYKVHKRIAQQLQVNKGLIENTTKALKVKDLHI